jgi:exodeoxyribonuclease-3
MYPLRLEPTPRTSNPIHNYFSRVSPPPIRNRVTSKWTIRGLLKNRKWPEFFCLQEVKILENDKTLISQARKAAMPDPSNKDDDGPQYTIYSTLPVVAKRASQNKPMYGVITYDRADTRGVSWDDEGRVLILELASLAILNVYAVNGTEAPYIPRSTGSPTSQTRHHRKRQFNHLLLQECISLHRGRGLQLCLVGDINISRFGIDSVPRLWAAADHVLARKEFNEIFLPRWGLVDAWREKHGDLERGYTWFNMWKEEGTD